MNIEEAKEEMERLARFVAEEEERRAEEENHKLVGRFFKYQNCYSCPEKPEDYWWLYTRVTGVDGRSLLLERFQTDKYGRIEVEPEYTRGYLTGYEEIDEAEYRAALATVQERIAAL